MLNIIHLSAIIVGILAYSFSNVNSLSGFYNTFLPFIVLISFIYGVLVTISLILRARNKPSDKSKSTDILLASLKEQGLLDKEAELASAAKIETSTIQLQPKQAVKHRSNIGVAKILALDESGDEAKLGKNAVNQQEWDNPENWSGSSVFAVYFSKRDSRTWVPSRLRLFGRSLNFAKSAAIFWLFVIWFATLVLFFLIFG